MNLGWPEILLILIIVLVLFGPKKLPEIAKGFGQALGEFKKAKDDFQSELSRSIHPAEPPPPPAVAAQNPQPPPANVAAATGADKPG